MRLHSLAALAALLLAGCETTPKTVPTPSAASSIAPADQLEAEILKAPNNAEALAEHAVDLDKLARVATDPETARDLRRRSYQFALAAKEQGTKNLLVPLLLGSTRPDGTEITVVHSSHAGANRLISEGEEKFGRGDLDGALDCYQRALELDPQSDRAALFAGDVFYSKREFAASLPWFERAVAINPNLEPAHRYRADALMKLRRTEEARDGYIQSFLCTPFAEIPTAALQRWARSQGVTITRPDSGFIAGDVKFDHGKPAMALYENHIDWIAIAYVGGRLKHVENIRATEKGYRHTLAEETSALRFLLQVAGELQQNKPDDELAKTHGPMLDLLRQFDREGLLEAHILFDRPTAGVAKDYGNYLTAHREQLARYLRTQWLRPSTAKTTPPAASRASGTSDTKTNP